MTHQWWESLRFEAPSDGSNTSTVVVVPIGTFDTSGDGVRYTPPAESFVDEFAMIVDGHDGESTYRYLFPRVMVMDKVEFSFVRSNPVMLPIKTKVLAAPGGGASFYFDTNDTSLVVDAP